MVGLWLRNIDDNSPRHPYLFETKSLKLSLIESFDSFDEYNLRNNTYSLYKLMLSLLGEGDKRFANAIKPKCCFWGGKHADSTFWYRFWVTSQSFCISKSLVYYIISCKDYVCYSFSFLVHQYLVHLTSHSHHLACHDTYDYTIFLW